FIFRRGSFSLRADRRRGIPAVWCAPLLVPENHWAHAGGASGQMEFLDFCPRLQLRLLPYAPVGFGGNAAPDLYIWPFARLGKPEFDRNVGSGDSLRKRGPVSTECLAEHAWSTRRF